MVKAVILNKKILIVLGAALALLLVVACGSDDDDNGDAGTAANISALLSSPGGSEAFAQLLESGSSANTGIWVNGTGKATGEPDLGIISLGVESLADTAAQARGQAADAIDRTISVLRENGIADRDLQTSHFNISPRYNTEEVTKCVDQGAPEPLGGPTPTPAPQPTVEFEPIQEVRGSECRVEFERVLIGYQVTNTLTVKVRDLGNMGGIIDGATAAAGDLIRINRVNFTIEDTKPLQAQAREEAIADMLTKASAMAQLAGVELGKLVFLTESGGGFPVPLARIESAAGLGFASDQATSILAGELDVNVSVQGVFDIAP